MTRISSAPCLQPLDGLTSFERAVRQPLMLGLFMPHQQGAWTPSKAPRKTAWTFEYNAELAVRVDEAGFDLILHLVGTPEMIVEWFVRLRQAGVDGVQVNFFDFGPDLDYFISAVLPLMQQAGLRRSAKRGERS